MIFAEAHQELVDTLWSRRSEEFRTNMRLLNRAWSRAINCCIQYVLYPGGDHYSANQHLLELERIATLWPNITRIEVRMCEDAVTKAFLRDTFMSLAAEDAAIKLWVSIRDHTCCLERSYILVF